MPTAVQRSWSIRQGTLTEARPTVRKVVSFCRQSEDELLRMAACLEEHFSFMAKAVGKPARKRAGHEDAQQGQLYCCTWGISSIENAW